MSEEKLSVRLETEAAVLRKQAELIRPKSIRHRELTNTIKLLTEAAKLARRVEKAQECEVTSVRPSSALPVYEVSPIDGLGKPGMVSKRVRLVREA